MTGIRPTAFVVFAAALVGAAGGGAQPSPSSPFGTPDGQPPPTEEICDLTSGAAHGLCVAYCEAMDCDGQSPNASVNACTGVAERFFQITGELPPCERICPCWEPADLETVTAENQDPQSCGGFPNVDALIQNVRVSLPLVEGGFSADRFFAGEPACFTRDFPPFRLFVSDSQFEACVEQIRARCAEIGTPMP